MMQDINANRCILLYGDHPSSSVQDYTEQSYYHITWVVIAFSTCIGHYAESESPHPYKRKFHFPVFGGLQQDNIKGE